MAIPGRLPNEKSVNRNPSRVESRVYADTPYNGPWPLELPYERTIITKDGQITVPLQPATLRWFEEVKRLPHAVDWDDATWGFVVDTAVNVVDAANCGVASAMVEQRQRESSEILKTHEARVRARVKYVPVMDKENTVELIAEGNAPVTDISARRRRRLSDA
jgi:hypothetical protein